MSVAIIPMAADLGWSPSMAGVVQSAFFWGYILCQLPGGTLVSRFGGRKVMPVGVSMWSLATAAVPLLAGTVPGLCASRAAVGLGEAVAPSAATDMVARIVPAHERSRAVSFVFSGLHLGSIAGLLAAPYLITHFGWETVFVSFGAAGLVWVLWFEQLMTSIAARDPEVAAALATSRYGSAAAAGGGAGFAPIPWRAFLRSGSVRALMYTHYCNNWFHYTMLAWLPTYFTDTLSVDLMHAAQTALLPPLAGIAASSVAGPAADALVGAGWRIATVRKLAQGVAFLAPTACLAVACVPSDDHWRNVGLITAALGLSSFSLAGLYCTHQVGGARARAGGLGVRCVGPRPDRAAPAYRCAGARGARVGAGMGTGKGGGVQDTAAWRPTHLPPSLCCLRAGPVAQVQLRHAGADQHGGRRARHCGRGGDGRAVRLHPELGGGAVRTHHPVPAER
jgi:ACS family sodium-dependent inorganic phosphate cotransporter